MAAKFTIGTLVKLHDPEELALGKCTHGLIVGLHSEELPEEADLWPGDVYRVLCDGRILLLADTEFEVVG